RRGRALEVPAVLLPRQARPTDRATVDPRRRDPDEEDAVEAWVARRVRTAADDGIERRRTPRSGRVRPRRGGARHRVVAKVPGQTGLHSPGRSSTARSSARGYRSVRPGDAPPNTPGSGGGTAARTRITRRE